MNKIITFAALLLGSSIFMSSCIKETFPHGGFATSDQIAQSPFAGNGIITAMPTILITNYLGTITAEHVNFGYPGLMAGFDRMAGEIFPVAGNVPGGNQYYDRWQPWLYPGNNQGLAPTGWAAALIYTNYYQFIHTANDAIAIASAASGKENMLGIAKTFRALYYLDLARLYDPLFAKAPNRPAYETEIQAVKELTIPKSIENMTLQELENNPRLTREEMFEFIFDDLNDAETYLEGYAPATKNLPSLAVVYGLKARAYLWLGGFSESYANIPTGNEAYRKAAEYARKAITASGASMMTESQWLDPRTGFNTVVSSWMWAMIQSTDTVLNNLLSFTAHMAGNAMYGYGYLAQPGISVFSYNRMQDGDFRKKIFVGPDRSYAAIAPYTTLTEAEFANTAAYASFKFKTRNGEKINFTVANVTDIPLMRVEEMYLIEAEATAQYDAGSGRSLLLSFMAQRNPSYTAPTENLIDEIIFQKRIEFWGESIVLYDMKRLNMSMHNGDDGTNAPSMARISTDGRAPWWNLAIPISATQQNKGIVNNPNPTQTVLSVD